MVDDKPTTTQRSEVDAGGAGLKMRRLVLTNSGMMVEATDPEPLDTDGVRIPFGFYSACEVERQISHLRWSLREANKVKAQLSSSKTALGVELSTALLTLEKIRSAAFGVPELHPNLYHRDAVTELQCAMSEIVSILNEEQKR